MLDLAGRMGRDVVPILAFAEGPAGQALAARGRALGFDPDAVSDWATWLAAVQPDVLHVHAGIGWEGHGLVALGAEARVPVMRTGHLPWLITDPRQRYDYAAMVGLVEAVVAVSRVSNESWRIALRHMAGPRLPLACVEMLGHRGDVSALMAEATALVLPSLFEGLPLVVLEAMAIGLPVVATRVGGVTEALGEDHPWLVEPGNRRVSALALGRATSQPAARARVAQAHPKRWRAGFTARRMANDMARIYRAVASRPRGNERIDGTRLGFVGAAGIRHRHFGTLGSIPDVEIAGICDLDANRVRQAFDRAGAYLSGPRRHARGCGARRRQHMRPAFRSWAIERACIARRPPSFVEKPLAADLATAEEIGRAVAVAGLITATSYFDALMTHRVALAVAQSARTGQVVTMEGLRLNPQPPFRPTAWADARRVRRPPTRPLAWSREGLFL